MCVVYYEHLTMSSKSVENGVVFQDNIKRERKTAASRQLVIETTTNLLKAVILKPTMWIHPDMAEVRALAYTICLDTKTFSPPVVLLNLNENTSTSKKSNIITSGFVTGIYDRSITSHDDTDDPPIVQVIESSFEYKSFYCGVLKNTTLVKVFTFDVTDISGELATVKVASQMRHTAVSVTDGTVIKLNRFNILYFDYNVKSVVATKPLVLALQFEIIDQFRSSFIPIKYSSTRLVLARAPTNPVHEKESDESTMSTQLSVDKSSVGSVSSPTNLKIVEPNASVLNCSGNICSVYCIHFCMCITKIHPVEELAIDDIVQGCHFMDSCDITKLENKSKRFVLYYYYSLNHYFATGKC